MNQKQAASVKIFRMQTIYLLWYILQNPKFDEQNNPMKAACMNQKRSHFYVAIKSHFYSPINSVEFQLVKLFEYMNNNSSNLFLLICYIHDSMHLHTRTLYNFYIDLQWNHQTNEWFWTSRILWACVVDNSNYDELRVWCLSLHKSLWGRDFFRNAPHSVGKNRLSAALGTPINTYLKSWLLRTRNYSSRTNRWHAIVLLRRLSTLQGYAFLNEMLPIIDTLSQKCV